jgi:hypothetical protein
VGEVPIRTRKRMTVTHRKAERTKRTGQRLITIQFRKASSNNSGARLRDLSPPDPDADTRREVDMDFLQKMRFLKNLEG